MGLGGRRRAFFGRGRVRWVNGEDGGGIREMSGWRTSIMCERGKDYGEEWLKNMFNVWT